MTKELNAKRTLAYRQAKNLQNNLCANADILVMVKDEGKKTEDYDITNKGCRNPRRNGSKWCQPCSDKHHATTST